MISFKARNARDLDELSSGLAGMERQVFISCLLFLFGAPDLKCLLFFFGPVSLGVPTFLFS